MTERIDAVRLDMCGLEFTGRNYLWTELEEL